MIYTLISIIFIIYILNTICDIFDNKKTKNDYYNRLNNINQKVSKSGYIKKVQHYIDYISNIKSNIILYIKPATIILFSIIISIIIFVLAINYLKVFSAALIISVYAFFIPYYVLKIIYNNYRKKINNYFPTYIISLKNYTQTSNDILVAMKKVKPEPPLSIFINRFNVSIENGIKVNDAFEKLKNDINIKKINEYISAVENCYINGGNFTILLDRYSKILNKTNEHREKELQDNLSSIIVLVILIVINIFLISTFIYSNNEYKNIVINTFIGKFILNINILSYLLIFSFVKKTIKLEE